MINNMNIRCQNCGASQDMHNVNNQCEYCDSIITSNQEIQKRIDQINSNGNLFRLAEVAFEGGDFDEAIMYYNKCLEIDTYFFEAWYKKGLSNFQSSTVGNLKSSQALSSIKQALNLSPNSESFKDRMKKDLIPIILSYINVSVDHYVKFRTVNGTGVEFQAKIEKTNDVTNFLINSTELTVTEIKTVYENYKGTIKKIQTGVALQEIGTKNNSGVGHAYKPLLLMEESLRELWERKSPNTAPSKRSCVIATAAMGDFNHPIVLDLRIFRDAWLANRRWGIEFTSWYYKHGPKAAKIIEKSNVLKKITFYSVVKPLHYISKKLQK